MSMISEVAKRYASALFEVSGGATAPAGTLEELRQVEGILTGSPEIASFFASPLVRAEDKVEIIEKTLQGAKLSEPVKNLALTLASRNRINEWQSIVSAFQARTDEANSVVRGTVKSAAPLGPDQRVAIEARVAQVTGKKVILEYKQEESLLGGLVAQVGSLTFDDSLETQLRLMNESLKRSAH